MEEERWTSDGDEAIPERPTWQWSEEMLDDDEGDCSAEDFGDRVVDILLSIKFRSRRLTAKDVCILCHYAHFAGAKGGAAVVKLQPKASSGHFQRHLDTVSAVEGQEKYLEKIALVQKMADGSRGVEDMHVVPFHE